MLKYVINRLMRAFFHIRTVIIPLANQGHNRLYHISVYVCVCVCVQDALINVSEDCITWSDCNIQVRF
jgi:hypothetical protein